MVNLSDNQMLERLKDFPKHELSSEQKGRTVEMIRSFKTQKPKRQYNFQRFRAAAAAVLILIMVPILYLSTTKNDQKAHQSSNTPLSEKVPNAITFSAVENKDGKNNISGNLVGIPNEIGISAPKEWIAEDDRSVAKIMVLLWNKNNKVQKGNLLIEGTHVKSGLREQLASVPLTAGIYGSDAHGITGFKPFSKAGIWDLAFKIDGKNIGEFSIEVKEPYVKIGSSTLMLSTQDVLAGEFKDVLLEVEGENHPNKINVELFNPETGASPSYFPFVKTGDYLKTDGKKISLYEGNLIFERSGNWRISALKQSNLLVIHKLGGRK